MTAARSIDALREAPAARSEDVAQAPERALARIRHSPAAWLAVVVTLSAAARFAYSLGSPSPWILPDEVVYSELAKSIAAGNRPSVREIPVFGWGEVYPTLIASVFAFVDDPVGAYRGVLAVNAVLMSAAAVPAYLLARLFVSVRLAFLVALMTVLVPSMTYTNVVMTENAFYPVFLTSVLLIARAVRRPTFGAQGLALLGLGVVAFTRLQGVALVGAYLAAIVVFALMLDRAERRPYALRFLPTVGVLAVVSCVPVLLSVTRGEGAFGWLGSRSGTFSAFHASEVPEWFLYLTGDLVLYVAVVPVAAATMAIGLGLGRRATPEQRLFAAVALPTFGAMLLSVAVVSAGLDVDGTENLNERYVFYVVPLAFVGLAAWIAAELPRPRLPSLAIVVGCAIVAATVPVHRLEYNAGFQSVALLPWIGLELTQVANAVAILVFSLVCGGLWLRAGRNRTGLLWALPAIVMLALGALAYGSHRVSADGFARAFEGRPRDWIDAKVPAEATVPVVWDERRATPGRPDSLYSWLMVTEFFNRRVGPVYRLGPPTYYEAFLPTVPATVTTDGTLVSGGRRVEARYVLANCRTPVAGQLLAGDRARILRLVVTDGVVRLTSPAGCGSDAGR